MQETIYDVWSAEARVDPYPTFHRMRAEDPVHWDGYSWQLTRHADVLFAFSDPRFSSERIGIPSEIAGVAAEELSAAVPLYDISQAMMLFRDPPAHTRLRGLVAQAFSAKMIEGMRPRIQELVDELLDEAERAGEFDLIQALANPLPGKVIAELLGVPAEDQPKFKHWANQYAAFLGGSDEAGELLRAGIESALAMGEYIRHTIALRKAEPRDDLMTALVQAEEEGDRLSELELVATVFLLLFAGNETTTNLIGNGTLTLLRQPEAFAQLRAHPEIIRTAVEELLRYESPVQLTNRRTLVDLEIGGVPVPAGANVQTWLGAANRDPEQFPDPDRLDLTRRPNRHLGLAHGLHFCLGAPLARAEGQIAINAVVQRFPGLRLAVDDDQLA
ncbi:MAG: cytochrome P450, partial [Chloroflexi bacterium]